VNRTGRDARAAGSRGEKGGVKSEREKDGRGGGAGNLKFGSLNTLNCDAFIKWADDYGIGADADAVKACVIGALATW
jgi:hypothetical protein